MAIVFVLFNRPLWSDLNEDDDDEMMMMMLMMIAPVTGHID